MVEELQPQRKLNLFLELNKRKANNARTRTLILRTILTCLKFEMWSVKYRKEMRKFFEHAWGKSTSILAAILKKEERTEKEYCILREHILRYLPKTGSNG